MHERYRKGLYVVASKIYRIVLYVLGIVLVSLGIVLCVKSGLGVSPISSVPFVLEYMTPLTFGTLTMLFHLANSAFQYFAEKRRVNVRVLLQIPVAFLFGIIIDFLKNVIVFEPGNIACGLCFMVASIVFTSLGMHLMLAMNLVQNPPDGTVNLLARITGKNVGTIKIIYDASMTLLSIVLSLFFLQRLEGFGVATICSAVFVGKVLNVFREHVQLRSYIKRYELVRPESL